MTREQLRARFPQASETFLRANADELPGRRGAGAARVSAPEPQLNSGSPLESAPRGEAKGCALFGERAYIEFHVFALQPLDWDNSFTKPLQDLLIEVGILAGDGWQQLRGQVIPHQVKTRKEERTEVRIWYH